MSHKRNPSLPGGEYRQIRQFRSPIPPTKPVDRDPCVLCGTRGDIGCRHKEAA